MTATSIWIRPAAAAVWIATRDKLRTSLINDCYAGALAGMVVLELEAEGGFERWRKEMHTGLLAGWRCQGRRGSHNAELKQIEPGEWRSNTPLTDFAVRGHDGPTSFVDLGILWADLNRAHPRNAVPVQPVREAEVRRWIETLCAQPVHPPLNKLREMAKPLGYSGRMVERVAREMSRRGSYQLRSPGEHDRKLLG